MAMPACGVADVILPGASYAEKPGTWVNLEGRVQRADRAVFPPGDAREDWTILRALSDALGKTLPFDTLDALARGDRGGASASGGGGAGRRSLAAADALARAVGSGAIVYPITDFYLTNPIARASETMQRCSAELLHGQDFAEAAE